MTDAETRNLFGAWNISFDYLPAVTGGAQVAAADQVDMLSALGYQGVVLIDASKLADFAAVTQVQSGSFKIIAVCTPLDLFGATDVDGIEATARGLKALGGGALWLIVSGLLMPAAVRERVIQVADIAAAHDVELVLYPHFGTGLIHAEDGVRWIKAIGRADIKVALNLAHELKVGNGPRLPEIIRNILPHLGAVTINGADRDVSGEEVEGFGIGYEKSIKTLGEGDYDVRSNYLAPLIGSGYSGPIVLHDLLSADRFDHFRRSMEVWKSWVDTTAD